MAFWILGQGLFSYVTAKHFCIFHVDNSTPPKDGGKLSSKQIALITVSVVVSSITASVAVYLLRYEGIFVSVLLVVKLRVAFLLLTEESLKRPPWEIQGGVIGHKERSCRFWEWAPVSDYVLKQYRLCSIRTFSIKLGMCKWLWIIFWVKVMGVFSFYRQLL